MTKQILFPLVALLLLFSSCSSRFGVMKRKYNKGYYIAHSYHKNNVSQSREAIASDHRRKQAPVLKEDVEIVKAAELARPVEKNQYTFPAFASRKIKASAKSTESPVYASVKKMPVTKELKQIPANVKTASGKGSDTDLIIQVILALFPILCLIAVYLHDGKDITLNFWIDLILHLTFIGEIIFALLVVLDVIDLK